MTINSPSGAALCWGVDVFDAKRKVAQDIGFALAVGKGEVLDSQGPTDLLCIQIRSSFAALFSNE
jgi:hypothetical protein